MAAITVVMWVYDTDEAYLRQAVESILNQVFTDLELFLYDDCSSPPTRAVLEEYAAADSRVGLYRTAANRLQTGDFNPRLILISGKPWAAGSEYTCELDSDDWYEPDFLELAYGLAKREDADIVAGDCSAFDEEGILAPNTRRFGPGVYKGKEEVAEGWLGGLHLLRARWNKLIRSSIYDKCMRTGFPPEAGTAVDYYSMQSAIGECAVLAFLGKVTHHYRVRRASESRSLHPFSALVTKHKALYAHALETLNKLGVVRGDRVSRFIERFREIFRAGVCFDDMQVLLRAARQDPRAVIETLDMILTDDTVYEIFGGFKAYKEELEKMLDFAAALAADNLGELFARESFAARLGSAWARAKASAVPGNERFNENLKAFADAVRDPRNVNKTGEFLLEELSRKAGPQGSESIKKRAVSVMTSCDDNLAPYIMPQLASLSANLKGYDVRFYLFHSRVKPETVESLRAYAEALDNLAFREVRITDTAPYDEIAGRGGLWPREAYFTLCCHEFLPEDTDRVLYIDAGDIIVDGDITPYYFDDFEGCSLIAILSAFAMDMDAVKARAKGDPAGLDRLMSMFRDAAAGDLDIRENRDIIRPYVQSDLNDTPSLEVMLKLGVFNSGCFVINVQKFRDEGRSISEYTELYRALCDLYPDRRQIYFGDQSFLSVAFVGDIKYFGYPDNFDLGYSPYNFGVWFMEGDRQPDYRPVVPHLTGVNYLKPWEARFSADEIRKYGFGKERNVYHAPFRLNTRQLELFEVWWKYCEMTPVYNELNEKARAAAKALEENYLPLCGWYNELSDEYRKATGKNPPRLFKHKLANDERLSF